VIKSIKLSLFEILHPNGKYFRLVLAFVTGMFFRFILMDIPMFSKYIINSKLAHLLSITLVKISHAIFSFLDVPVHSFDRNIALYDSVGVLVNDTCLGIRGIILFTFFILFYYGKAVQKVVFIFFGIGILEIGNIFRIVTLAYVQYCCPQNFDFVHFYLSKIIFYGIILVLWIYWVEFFNKKRSNLLT